MARNRLTGRQSRMAGPSSCGASGRCSGTADTSTSGARSSVETCTRAARGGEARRSRHRVPLPDPAAARNADPRSPTPPLTAWAAYCAAAPATSRTAARASPASPVDHSGPHRGSTLAPATSGGASEPLAHHASGSSVPSRRMDCTSGLLGSSVLCGGGKGTHAGGLWFRRRAWTAPADCWACPMLCTHIARQEVRAPGRRPGREPLGDAAASPCSPVPLLPRRPRPPTRRRSAGSPVARSLCSWPLERTHLVGQIGGRPAARQHGCHGQRVRAGAADVGRQVGEAVQLQLEARQHCGRERV